MSESADLCKPRKVTDWRRDCALQQVRRDLNGHLTKINGDRDWSFILNQVGMFSFTGLNKVRLYQHPAMAGMAVPLSCVCPSTALKRNISCDPAEMPTYQTFHEPTGHPNMIEWENRLAAPPCAPALCDWFGCSS